MAKLNKVVPLAAGAAAVALSLAACSSSDTGTSEAGDPVTVACGVQEDLCQGWSKAFTAATGFKANFVRLSSGEAVARLGAAKNSPEFDVWHGGPADGYGAAQKLNLLEAYQSPNAAAIPDKYKEPQGYWTGVYVGVLGFCSNQKKLDEAGVPTPESWDALLDPKLKGQVSTAHPSTSGTAFTMLWTQVQRLGGEEQAFAYMKKLHQNVLQYSKSGSAPGQIVGRGEASVGLIFSHDCVKFKEEGMSDLKVSFPSDGTGYEVGGVALVAGGDNTKAAKAYVDWALTAQAQSVGQTVGSYQVPTNPQAKLDERMIKLDQVKLVEYDFAKAAAAKSEMTARFDAQIAAQPRE